MEKLTDGQKNKIFELVKDTNLTYREIAEQFGVSKQLVWSICRGIDRPKSIVMSNHRVDRCLLCQKIMKAGAVDTFYTTRQLAELLGVAYKVLIPHLIILRKHKLVPKGFCFFRNDKIIEAIKIFQESDVSAREAGIKAKVPNFTSVLWRARQRGIKIEKINLEEKIV